MRRTSIALGLFVVVLVATAAAPSPALAQDETNSTSGDDAPLGFEDRVDESVILADWSYNDADQEFLLTFESDSPSRITISEVLSVDQAGSGRLSIQRRTIPAGTTTIDMPAGPGPNSEAAVMISTADSIDEGSGVFVSTGQVSSDPFSAFGGTQGLFIGIVLTCVFALLSSLVTLWRENSGVEVAT